VPVVELGSTRKKRDDLQNGVMTVVKYYKTNINKGKIMAYTELNRINYSVGRLNIEEVYISGGAVSDTIKSRLSKPKYVAMILAPNTATTHTVTNTAAASLVDRTATIQSFNISGTPQLLVRFVGV
jgi:hypothetical protein